MSFLLNLLLKYPRISTAMIFIIALGANIIWVAELDQAEQSEQAAALSEIAIMQSHALESRIRENLAVSYAVAAHIKEKHGEAAQFQQFANALIPFYPGVAAIYLAPGGITSVVIPKERGDAGLGLNLLTNPNHQTESRIALQSGQLTLAGPLPLLVGKTGLIGRLPVFLPSEAGDVRFWGFISVVIEMDKLIASTEVPLLSQRGYEYRIWRRQPNDGEVQIIHRSEGYSGAPAVSHRFALPNTEWYFDLKSAGKTNPILHYGRYMVGLILSLMLTILIRMLATNWGQKKQLHSLVKERTRELAETEQDLKRAQAISHTGNWSAPLSGVHFKGSEEAFRIWRLDPNVRVNKEILLSKVHADDQAKVTECWQKACAGQSASAEYRLVFDEETRWVHSELTFEVHPTEGRRLIGTTQDITSRKRVENDLRIAAIAFEGQEGIVITDEQRKILRINQAFTRITGYSRGEAVGKTTSLLKSGIHGGSFYKDMAEQLDSKGVWQGEIWNRRKNGEIYPEWLTITAIRSESGDVVNYVGTMLDITQRKATEAKLEHLAYHDPLTGLANRRLLLNRLQHAMVSNTRSNRFGAILFLDLDNFKTINDTSGHGKGDLILQHVAKRLQARTGKGDTLARIGGDEFALIIEDLSDQIRDSVIEVKSIANQILEEIKKPFTIEGQHFHTTASLGIELFGASHTSAEELLRQVEVAMYEAKSAGGDNACFFDPAMLNIIAARAEMEADLRNGLRQHEFRLFYQAQVNSTGKWLGAEALLRWQHPQKGMVSPAEFIPLAEETGLIVPIGKWVLHQACAQLALWQTDPAYASMTMSVNVSAKQFRQDDFVDTVLEAVTQHQIQPGSLKLELTESLLLDNVEQTITRMHILRSYGICFSLDDFGTGYSSLTYLKRLPLEQLKIDQSFVRDILVNPSDAAIVRTIVGLGKSLGLSVIAEGVEQESQRSFLQTLDCHAYQGYLFGKPSATLSLPQRGNSTAELHA